MNNRHIGHKVILLTACLVASLTFGGCSNKKFTAKIHNTHVQRQVTAKSHPVRNTPITLHNNFHQHSVNEEGDGTENDPGTNTSYQNVQLLNKKANHYVNRITNLNNYNVQTIVKQRNAPGGTFNAKAFTEIIIFTKK